MKCRLTVSSAAGRRLHFAPAVLTCVLFEAAGCGGSSETASNATPSATAQTAATPEVVTPAAGPSGRTGRTDQDRIVAAVQRDSPSVVALDVSVNGKRLIPADPFSQLFGLRGNARIVPYREQASGSGFVYSNDGLIVTNAHVVQFGAGSSTKITVVFANGDNVAAHLYAANPAADLALVKVDGYGKLPSPLELGRSSEVKVGQWAIAIGEPFELQQSVSVGVVSAFNRTETIGDEGGNPRTFKGLLQTSAPINPGNSGGPLIDYDGRLIGINQSVASPQAGAQGIGFAIPVDTIKQQVALLQQHPGQVNGPPEPYIGVSMISLNDNIRSELHYQGSGVAIEGVFRGGPADKAGLQPGDVIQKINGNEITSVDQVQSAIHSLKPGQDVTLHVWSSDREHDSTVTVGTAPANYPSG